MIRHIVTIALKPDVDPAQVAAFVDRLGPISSHANAIDWRCGWNFQDIGPRCDFAISCAFETRAAFDEYMAHPDHGPPGELLSQIAEHYSVIDYEEHPVGEVPRRQPSP